MLNSYLVAQGQDRVWKRNLQKSRYARISVDGNILSYLPNDLNKVGVFISDSALSREDDYFEVEILDTGVSGCIGIGIAPYQYRLDAQPGWSSFSIGYHADDGKLFKSQGHGKAFGPKCKIGDFIGCGIKFTDAEDNKYGQKVDVFFTRNGKEVGSCYMVLPPGGFFPAIGMHSDGEEVRLFRDVEWHPEDLMAVDSSDDEWCRLHDIRMRGSLLEYTGRGKTICDVGLAQATYALDTQHHYFEIEIIDPGESCFIAIGLARRDYPQDRHPGWNKGSIAYHADDGKIFVGCGIGDPFGPKCNKGDVMGCGILFPCDYNSDGADVSPDEVGHNGINIINVDNDYNSDSDEEWWERPNQENNGKEIKVFFTRNGKIIGDRNVVVPKGGFYPTIGMLSCSEKVTVDMRPLTG